MQLFSRQIQFNPAQLFVISFAGLVCIGTILLKLPFATTNGIHFIDALFTATSAVCITGLAVVDTETAFTLFGQTVIMLLIQSGGLGILTFASYFSFFFKGGSSFETQIAMADISEADKLGDIFKTLKRILLITLSIECIGAIFIYASIDPLLLPSWGERAFFALFHAISAFCNAGFSLLSNGIMQEGYVTNYAFQLSLIFLFVMGGLGFPIVVNLIKYVKHIVKSTFLRLARGKKNVHKPWVLTLGSRINLATTFTLIVVGTVLFFVSEYSNTLSPHHGVGKFVTALFSSTVSRTAGFNSIDYGQLHTASVLLIICLMWIGASPVSTGGGIKTSTFAILVLNIISLAKGKNKIEVYRREISDISVRRAFATVGLSIFAIGFGAVLVSIFDPQFSFLTVLFECVSAYGTVGLTMGITTKLGIASKVVICFLMFIGRVTFLTVLIALFKHVRKANYAYPTEEITIN